MIREKISKFNIDNNFFVNELYVFTNESNHYSFVLGKNGCSIIVDNTILNSIKNRKIDENLQFKLIQHGLATLKNPNIRLPTKKNKNIYFIIDITKKCNFNCLYCFRNLNDNRIIKNEVLKDICQYILNIVKQRHLKNVAIQVWGGEPLLAIDKLEYIYNFFKNTSIKVKIDVETNGSLITEELASRLYNLNVNIGISLDGLKQHQDIQRRLLNNRSSNELVINGIKNLKKYYKNKISGIAVITKYNYKDIALIINYFTNYLQLSNMKFNIVKDNPNANEKNVGLTLKEIKDFANKLFDVIELYNSLGFPFNEGNIQARISNLLERNNSSYCISNGCKGGINLISIDMDGNIFPCEMMDYKEVKLGSIYAKNHALSNNKDLNNYISKAKKNNIYFREKTNKECKNCPWQYYCQGGCTSRILYSHGKMKYDEQECEFNKIIYERIINQILKNIK